MKIKSTDEGITFLLKKKEKKNFLFQLTVRYHTTRIFKGNFSVQNKQTKNRFSVHNFDLIFLFNCKLET